jgi:hypothetical protein
MLAQEISCAPLEEFSFLACVKLKQHHSHTTLLTGRQFKVARLKDFLSDAV